MNLVAFFFQNVVSMNQPDLFPNIGPVPKNTVDAIYLYKKVNGKIVWEKKRQNKQNRMDWFFIWAWLCYSLSLKVCALCSVHDSKSLSWHPHLYSFEYKVNLIHFSCLYWSCFTEEVIVFILLFLSDLPSHHKAPF